MRIFGSLCYREGKSIPSLSFMVYLLNHLFIADIFIDISCLSYNVLLHGLPFYSLDNDLWHTEFFNFYIQLSRVLYVVEIEVMCSLITTFCSELLCNWFDNLSVTEMCSSTLPDLPSCEDPLYHSKAFCRSLLGLMLMWLEHISFG